MITITGTPEEIAALVVAIQERQAETTKPKIVYCGEFSPDHPASKTGGGGGSSTVCSTEKPADNLRATYDGMTAAQLVSVTCCKGRCSDLAKRRAVCPLRNTIGDCTDYLNAHPEMRETLIQYLIDEEKPAPKFKVGDKVKVVKTSDNFREPRIGEILEIKSLYPNGKDSWPDTINYGVDKSVFVWFEDELEAYVEPKSPFFTGKMVCIEAGIFHSCWTAGKVYSVKDGTVNDDVGDTLIGIKSPASVDLHPSIKFIEFKGE